LSAETTFRSVAAGDASLWSARHGRGPALVLLHGGPGMWDYLEPVGRGFEDIATIYRYDQRGCGRSSGGPPHDVATAVADLEAVRAAWEVERWVVFGHSWGATLALAYAVAHPDRVRGLVHVSGTGVDPAWHEAHRAERLARLSSDQVARWHDLRARRSSATGDERARVEREYDRLRAVTDLADQSRADDLLAWLHADGFAVNYEVNGQLGADASRFAEQGDLPERLASLSVPALVIHGALDPRPARFAARVAELIPGADLVVMPNVGHFPRFEAPRQFNKLVRGFLARVDLSSSE
jgi:proline iminopeptidase